MSCRSWERGEKPETNTKTTLPLLIFKSLFHIIQNVYRTKGECHLMLVSEHVLWVEQLFDSFFFLLLCQPLLSKDIVIEMLLNIRSAGQLKWISFSFLLQLLEPSCLLKIISTHTPEESSWRVREREKATGLLWDSAYAQWPLTCLSSPLSRCPVSSERRKGRSQRCYEKNRVDDVHRSGYFSFAFLPLYFL